MYTQDEVDRIVKDEVDRIVKEAIHKERVHSTALETAYKALLDEQDRALIETRNQLNSTLEMINDKSKEFDDIKCEVVRKALKQRLCVPASCALESVLKPAFIF